MCFSDKPLKINNAYFGFFFLNAACKSSSVSSPVVGGKNRNMHNEESQIIQTDGEERRGEGDEKGKVRETSCNMQLFY